MLEEEIATRLTGRAPLGGPCPTALCGPENATRVRQSISEGGGRGKFMRKARGGGQDETAKDGIAVGAMWARMNG